VDGLQSPESGSMTTEPRSEVVHIRADVGAWFPRLGDVWRYRELLLFLTWRDIKVRYRQTALGAGWAILQPVLTMLVFSVVFGRLAKLPSDGLPYPIFVYCGLLPWQLFAFALVNSANSLVASERLVSKVYFPRLVVPIASVLAGLVDFLVAFVVLFGLMLHYGRVPPATVVVLPLLVLMTLGAATAVGIGLSALNVRFRDVRHALVFLTQFWLFATPIAYSSALVPEAWRPMLALNPMAGVVEGFRWALLGVGEPGAMLPVSLAVIVLGLTASLAYFARVERTFADVL
jgi:lipopolysaccharide transport system permease protein